MKCYHKKTAPSRMSRGSATTDGQFAYFIPWGSTSVYRYEWSGEKWEELPSCPYKSSGLVVIEGKLVAVGGEGRSHTTKLVTLQQRKWVEEYPPMSTACSAPAVISTSDGEYLIVIGGWGGGGWTATVQLFQVKRRRWYKLTDLPQSLHFPSAAICDDQLNVIGVDANGYSCSLQAPPSNYPFTSPLTSSWKPLPPLPVTFSTAATLCGQLVLIGGMRRDGHGSSDKSIHKLVDGQWEEIGSMATGRYICLVASPSSDKIIIVGGDVSLNETVDIVEECIVAQ